MSNNYNGWKNWETWAARLWLDGIETNLMLKNRYLFYCNQCDKKPTYTDFLRFARGRFYNGDVSPNNSRISRTELTRYLQEDFEQFNEYRRQCLGEG